MPTSDGDRRRRWNREMKKGNDPHETKKAKNVRELWFRSTEDPHQGFEQNDGFTHFHDIC